MTCRLTILFTFLMLGTLTLAAQTLIPVQSGVIPREEPYFQRASGIGIDAGGQVYVVDSGLNQVSKFDREGRPAAHIGGFGSGEGQFDTPVDLFALKTLDIYVADYFNNRVVRLDKNLNFLNALSSDQVESPYRFERVLSVAVSPQYDLFLLEEGQKQVIKFDRSTDPSTVFGGMLDPYGQLLEPRALALESNKRVFVSDPGQPAVVVFDYFGNFLTTLSHPALEEPASLYWGEDQRLYVGEPSGTLWIFNPQLKLETRLQLPLAEEPLSDIAVSYQLADKSRTLYALSPTRCRIFQLKTP
ncbi:MAG TPA: NHL repeat-containing protein [Calditrichia bacterium]|nr:NHL repeat-containing protein [Calditrichota bacterium]HQU72186.1 NHL repeat-containing protein [Calditrichia bacterium]HQV30826.1 NHL repeat-containing protein [Calditrichia bacterium]